MNYRSIASTSTRHSHLNHFRCCITKSSSCTPLLQHSQSRTNRTTTPKNLHSLQFQFRFHDLQPSTASRPTSVRSFSSSNPYLSSTASTSTPNNSNSKNKHVENDSSGRSSHEYSDRPLEFDNEQFHVMDDEELRRTPKRVWKSKQSRSESELCSDPQKQGNDDEYEPELESNSTQQEKKYEIWRTSVNETDLSSMQDVVQRISVQVCVYTIMICIVPCFLCSFRSSLSFT